jgi:hypothetical protein
MAEIRLMSICTIPSRGGNFVFHGPIPNAPGFGFFAKLPHITGWMGGQAMVQGVEHLILPLADVAEATTEQLNKIDRRWFNIPVQPQQSPPPLFQ